MLTSPAEASNAAAVSSVHGPGQTVLGEGPEILYRRLREVQDADGFVARQLDEMRQIRFSPSHIGGRKEVRSHLEQFAQEVERRTNLLANGLTAADGLDKIRTGVLQLESMVGSYATEASTCLQQLAQSNDEIRASGHIEEWHRLSGCRFTDDFPTLGERGAQPTLREGM